MTHEELVEKANEAIQKVFGDTSVEWSVTLDSLEGIACEAQSFADTLKEEHAEDD